MAGDRETEIISLRSEGHEYVNGIAVPLAQMSLRHLLGIEKDTRARLVEAQTDLMIVRDVLDARYPDPGSAA